MEVRVETDGTRLCLPELEEPDSDMLTLKEKEIVVLREEEKRARHAAVAKEDANDLDRLRP